MAIVAATLMFGLAVPSGAKDYPPTPRHHQCHAFRVDGFPRVGRTVTVTITGTGFYGKPTITSTEPGLTAFVTHDHGNSLDVPVTIKAGEPTGWQTFTISLADGNSCKVNFLVKLPTPHAFHVYGFPRVGRTVTVTITGTGFYGTPTITSTEPGLTAIVTHDYGKWLVVPVTIKAGEPRGWHTFTITLANGSACQVNFLVKQVERRR
jgi:hypothetical protein